MEYHAHSELPGLQLSAAKASLVTRKQFDRPGSADLPGYSGTLQVQSWLCFRGAYPTKLNISKGQFAMSFSVKNGAAI